VLLLAGCALLIPGPLDAETPLLTNGHVVPREDPAAKPESSKPAPSTEPSAELPAAAPVPATNDTPGVRTVNPALAESAELIASSNLITAARPDKKAERLRNYQVRLELARRQRLERDTGQAVERLVELLETDAPEEIKKTALLELALAAQQENELPRAQQVFNQYLKTYSKDPSVPEVLLRQGLLYRQMGAPTMALSKFYAVMSTAMALKLDNLEPYQRLVLQAQTEIAETYFLQAKYEEAADFFKRLLKLDSPALNKPQIQFKLMQALDWLGEHNEAAALAEDFLKRFPNSVDEAQVRFLFATALKQLGRKNDALQQVIRLLQGQQSSAKDSPETWSYWQQRAGNEIANQLYNGGDYLHALEIYLDLAQLRDSLAWQVPVWYQIGLTFERLQQPARATEQYLRILGRESEIASNSSSGLKAVLDMAKWRKDFLNWQSQAEHTSQTFAVNRAQTRPDSTPK
jgi:tetratricopeptide (TPR) repeat protein